MKDSSTPASPGGTLRLGVWSQCRMVHDGLEAWLSSNRPTVRAMPIQTRSPSSVGAHVLLVLGAGAAPTHMRDVVQRFRRHGVPVVELDAAALAPARLGIDHWSMPTRTATSSVVDFAVRLALRPVVDIGLTKREAEALVLYAHGMSARETADHLGVSYETVRTFLRRSRAKIRESGRGASTKEELRSLISRAGEAS